MAVGSEVACRRESGPLEEWGEEEGEEDVLFQAKAVNEVDAGRDRATRSEMI